MRPLERARFIRDRIIALDAERGRWAEDEGPRTRVVERPRSSARLWSPFNPLASWPTPVDSYEKAMALKERGPPLPWQLDLWIAGEGKVLSVEWDQERTKLISMRRGDWEQHLFDLLPAAEKPDM